MAKRISALFLAMMIAVIGIFAGISVSAAEKETTSKTIGIVFDNSGSMYLDGKMDWCRATYAMEIFASMMNSGDTMYVYPMNEIEVDGKTYTMDSPLVISGPSDANIIEQIYTTNAQGTPIETVDSAYEDLKNKSGEKWLIVLTDGTAFDKDDEALPDTKSELETRLNSYRETVNIMYLAVGEEAIVPDETSSGSTQFYVDKASDSQDILEKLSNMNSLIFGRDAMKTDGNSISTDLSFSKLIVLVQGENISKVKVVDKDGNACGEKTGSSKAKYSTQGCSRNGSKLGTPDTSLQSMMVTYSNVPAGNYTLKYKGTATKVDVYYEPDVTLSAVLVNSDGNTVTGDTTLYAGDYSLVYGLIDNQTGKVATSDLLGNTNYSVSYNISGKDYTAASKDKYGTQSVTLKAGDSINGSIAVDYLSGYHQDKSFENIGWPMDGYIVEKRLVESEKMSQDISGGEKTYNISDFEENAHYKMEVSYNGEQLTGDALDRVIPHITTDNDNITPEVTQTEDGFEIELKFNGDPLSAELGDCNLITSFEYTNEDGATGSSEECNTPFNVTARQVDSAGMGQTVGEGDLVYYLSNLEEDANLIMTIYEGDRQITGSELDRVTPYISTDNDNITAEYTQVEEGFLVHLKFIGDPLDTKLGDFNIISSHDYTNEDGVTGSSEVKYTSFTILDSTYTLETSIILDKSSATNSELDDLAPVRVEITKNGQPVTDEEKDGLNFNIDTEGLLCDDPVWVDGESAYEFKLKSSDDNKVGKYKFSATVSGTDDMGRTIESSDEAEFMVTRFPAWLKFAVAGGALLLILLLIAFWLTRKVMPKKINRAPETDFTVGGKTIEDNAKVSYNKSGKTLSIQAPQVETYPYISCAVKLTLKKVDKRIVPSAKRRVEIVEVKAAGDITSIEIGSTTYEKDDTGKFVKDGSNPVYLRNNHMITINGTSTNSAGRKKPAVLSQQLKFK